jgi:hypothetical protein
MTALRRVPRLLITSGVLFSIAALSTFPVMIAILRGETIFLGAILVMLCFPFFVVFSVCGLACVLTWFVKVTTLRN